MASFIKKILYKILVASMITVCLSFFSVSSVSQAKLSLDESEFYYTGTQSSEVMFEASFFQKFVKKLKDILNFLIGAILLAMRSVVIGWIEIAEIVLTAILGEMGDENDFFTYMQNSLAGIDTYSQHIVNVERIIFNKIKLFDIDIFDSDKGINNAAGGKSTEPQFNTNAKIIKIIKESIAKWYVTLRLVVIAMMLLLLIFIGIKIAFAVVASEKSVYKQMLIDWVVGIIMIFSIHYIMSAIIYINNNIVEAVGEANNVVELGEPYEYGEKEKAENNRTPSEIEFTLYESARTRAYSVSILDGIAGTIIYGALVYYAWKYALIYLRRVLNIMILTIISPIIAGTYAFNKTMSGGSPIFSNWLKEYIINVIIQVFHAIIYITLVSTAFDLALQSLLGVALAIVLLSTMSKFGELLRQLFNISGGSGSLFEEMTSRTNFKNMRSAIKNIPTAIVGGKTGMKALKTAGRITTKPIRKAAEVGFGKSMEAIANSKRHKDRVKKKEEDKQAKAKELYEEYSNSDENVAERKKLESREEELYNKKEKIQREKSALKRKLDLAVQSGDQVKIDDLTKKIEAKEEEERENDNAIIENARAIEDFEADVQSGFLDYYVRSQSSWDVVKDNFANLFKPENYVDKEDITSAQIDEKAREMFPDYDKYQQIIANHGKTGKDAKLYKMYNEMNSSKASMEKIKKLKDDNYGGSLVIDDYQKKLLSIDLELKTLGNTKEDQERREELEEDKEFYEDEIREWNKIIAENNKKIDKLEDKVVSKYNEYFTKEKKISKDDIENNYDSVFNRIEDKVDKLEEKVYESEKKAQQENKNVDEAYEKIAEMQKQAEEALTKYKVKKTKREGDSNYAFWHKKKSGVGKIFLDNAKLDKILGISSEEKKVIKEQAKEAKSMVLGAVSGIAGVGLIGANPAVGFPLLINSINTRMDTFSKMRQVRNSPSRLKFRYRFRKFGEGSQKVINTQMGKEIRFAESRMTRFNIGRHPVLRKIIETSDDYVIHPVVRGSLIFSGIALGGNVVEGGLFNRHEQPYADVPKSHFKRKIIANDTFALDKLDDIYQKKARKAIKEARKELVELNTKTFEDEYKSETKLYKEKIKSDVESEKTEDLILEDVLSSDDVIKVGEDTIIEYEDSEIPNIDFGNQDIKFSNSQIREQRIEKVKNLITEDKDKYIQMAIINLAMSKKVMDISHLEIDDRDIMAIRQDIKERFERKGHLRKGDLKINKIILETDVKEVLGKLKNSSRRSNSNAKIAEGMVKKACFGYMTQNNITDPNMLNSSDAQAQIAAMVSSQLVSKSSQNVVNQINGQNQPIGPSLPDSLFNIGEKIDKVTSKMKRKSVKQVKTSVGRKLTRRQLVERSIIRRENTMKSNLESAMYTGDNTQVADEAQLKMLFLLSEIGKQNRTSYKVEGKRAKQTKEKTLDEMRYQQYKLNPENGYTEEEDNQNLNVREEDLNVLLHGRRDIIDVINKN